MNLVTVIRAEDVVGRRAPSAQRSDDEEVRFRGAVGQTKREDFSAATTAIYCTQKLPYVARFGRLSGP